MQWRKNTTIPKFGNWDKKEDVSYSIVFDAARADKEKFMYMSHEDEHERALFQKMSKDLKVTPNHPNLEAKTSDLADNNVKVPYHHTPIIGNEIPKQTNSLGLKDSINGEPTYEIKENRFENHAQFLYESHHTKLQGKSNESRTQGNPAAKKVCKSYTKILFSIEYKYLVQLKQIFTCLPLRLVKEIGEKERK